MFQIDIIKNSNEEVNKAKHFKSKTQNKMVEIDPRTRAAVAELPAEGEDGEQQLEPINFDGMETEELFNNLESTIVGYDDY